MWNSAIDDRHSNEILFCFADSLLNGLWYFGSLVSAKANTTFFVANHDCRRKAETTSTFYDTGNATYLEEFFFKFLFF